MTTPTLPSEKPPFRIPPRSSRPPLQKGSRVVVGLSGGVDSSVTAWVLKQQGYDVVGLFMKNWDEKDENGVCHAAQDFEDVQKVCEVLDIPCFGVEFIEEYSNQVFEHFLKDFQAGLTPNPDILCNREIKFHFLLEKAFELGGEALATGHYCRLGRDPQGHTTLLKGADGNKDQTYFLAAVPQTALDWALFPIGDLPKPEVRRIARENKIPTHAKPDSTGICFIGERRFRPFLKTYFQAQPGEMRRLDGTRVGRHEGVAYYTLGQRKGLGLGGEGEPWFVVRKDLAANILYVERGTEHPALFASDLTANEASWILPTAPTSPFRCSAKVRYRQPDQNCTVQIGEDGSLAVRFDQPQRAITPGQYVVFYDGDQCLGGAKIQTVGPSLWDLAAKPTPFSVEV